MLSYYQGVYKNKIGVYKHKITVVFDTHLVKDSKGKITAYDNLEIVFTKENITADNYIEKFVHDFGNIYTIRTVTSASRVDPKTLGKLEKIRRDKF